MTEVKKLSTTQLAKTRGLKGWLITEQGKKLGAIQGEDLLI
jgi:hypothetical protein